jgi:hydroxylaminobenzene mutase
VKPVRDARAGRVIIMKEISAMSATSSSSSRAGHRLLQLGVLLFLLGLLTGFGMPLYANARMGLSSHLEGVMNGMLLVMLGLIWDRLRLGRATSMIAVVLAIYGTFTNWVTTLLAAVWGAGAMMPLAAGAHHGTPVQEMLIAAGLWSLSISMVVVSVIVLWGLRRASQVTLTSSTGSTTGATLGT